MNKKPIKRNENILKLSKEHHFSLLFCWKIRQGLKTETDSSRIIKYVQYFTTDFLLPHFSEEEIYLFSSLNDEQVEKAIEQHTEIKNLLAELLDTEKDSSKQQLEKLANLVDEHVRYEERELFPHIENSLTREQLKEIGKKLNDSQPVPMKDVYADEFWIKNRFYGNEKTF